LVAIIAEVEAKSTGLRRGRPKGVPIGNGHSANDNSLDKSQWPSGPSGTTF